MKVARKETICCDLKKSDPQRNSVAIYRPITHGTLFHPEDKSFSKTHRWSDGAQKMARQFRFKMMAQQCHSVQLGTQDKHQVYNRSFKVVSPCFAWIWRCQNCGKLYLNGKGHYRMILYQNPGWYNYDEGIEGSGTVSSEIGKEGLKITREVSF